MPPVRARWHDDGMAATGLLFTIDEVEQTKLRSFRAVSLTPAPIR